MDTSAAAELEVGRAMAGDSVVLWDGAANEGAAGWSDEDYDEENADWSNKNRRYPPPQHKHPRSLEKRARLMPSDGPAASFSSRTTPVGDPALMPSYANDPPEFPGPMRAANGGGVLQKQNSIRGSNSFELAEMGPTLIDSSPASGNTSSAVKSKGTGSIFFKTKLCCKFRAGTCPYNSNCNFAHGMEELRKPPPGWEEMVAAQEAERALRGANNNQIQVVAEPTGGGNQGDNNQRFHKTPRPCRKFYTEEGCPYGDRCIFMHDDQGSQVRVLRESNAISLGPMTGQANGSPSVNGSNERSQTWKTRVCNKWETTGHCPFGQKCHFVHSNSDGPSTGLNSRHGSGSVVLQAQRQGSKAQLKWKGPADEISTIYGDWIEEDEWESMMAG